MSATGDAALEYARRGLPVLPLHTPDEDGRCSCGRDCATPGKHPRTQHGLKDATTDEATVRGWWGMWPEAGVAIRMGAGRVALDIDRRHGGDDALESLQAAHGRGLPATAKVATGGGFHLHFKAPAGTPSRTLAPGVELKGDGSYVVAPPSIHASGKEYTWVDDVEPAPAPAWLLEDARDRRNGAAPPVEGRIPEGERNTTLTSIAGTMRRRDMDADEIEAALKVANQRRCVPPLDDDEVRRIAESVGRYPPEGAAPVGFDQDTGQPVSALERVRRDFPSRPARTRSCESSSSAGRSRASFSSWPAGRRWSSGPRIRSSGPGTCRRRSSTPPASPSRCRGSRSAPDRPAPPRGRRGPGGQPRRARGDGGLGGPLRSPGLQYSFAFRDPSAAIKLENLRQPDPDSFVEGDVAYIRLAHLRRHIVTYRREQPISTKVLSERLGRIGYRRRQISERDPETDKVLKGRFYAGPWGGS